MRAPLLVLTITSSGSGEDPKHDIKHVLETTHCGSPHGNEVTTPPRTMVEVEHVKCYIHSVMHCLIDTGPFVHINNCTVPKSIKHALSKSKAPSWASAGYCQCGRGVSSSDPNSVSPYMGLSKLSVKFEVKNTQTSWFSKVLTHIAYTRHGRGKLSFVVERFILSSE